jgi:hypothetical protein
MKIKSIKKFYNNIYNLFIYKKFYKEIKKSKKKKYL